MKIGNIFVPVHPDFCYISSGFGLRNRNGVIEFHRGYDFATYNKNIPVFSCFDGVVIVAGLSNSPGTGKRVFIQDKITRLYEFFCHLDEVLVLPNQKIIKGDVIGMTGNTGCESVGIHLHYERRLIINDKNSSLELSPNLLQLFRSQPVHKAPG